MQIAAVILAAGAATRFGSPKQLARIGDRTMLEMVADIARQAGLQPVIAVVPPGMAVPPTVVPQINDAPSDGLSRSLSLGLAAVPPEVGAAVILLGDQPTLASATIRMILDAAGDDRPLVAASAAGRIGPPVLVRRDAFALAHEATGDVGLRSILARHPELVTIVEVREHAPDIDTREDLASLGEPCPGCGTLFQPPADGATHAYLGSSAGCWAAFGELLAREFGDGAYGAVHRHTVDAYAAQHPGVNGRRQRQSVALHLVGLCHWIEYGLTSAQLTPLTRALAKDKREWPWLNAPSAYRLTVLDVLRATAPDEHGAIVRAWAESVWEAWSSHHELVRGWAADALSDRR